MRLSIHHTKEHRSLIPVLCKEAWSTVRHVTPYVIVAVTQVVILHFSAHISGEKIHVLLLD